VSATLCIALDSRSPAECLRLAVATESSAGIYKVGLTAFVPGGRELVERLGGRRPVFLDLKLHDIPAQVEGAVEAAAQLGVRYVTVHASGGAGMIKAAVAAAGDNVDIVAVTLLTSMDELDLRRAGVSGSAEDHVLRLAELALGAGVPALVCSPREIRALRARFGGAAEGGPLLVVPGIRADGGRQQDQRRTATARAAADDGADVVVIGRPITAADDPGTAAEQIVRALAR
jgi:orotidine-5'-phosphate decarboxylase